MPVASSAEFFRSRTGPSGTGACSIIHLLLGLPSTVRTRQDLIFTDPLAAKGALLDFAALSSYATSSCSNRISFILGIAEIDFDTGMNEALMQSTIATLEAQGLTQDQIDQALSFSPEPGSMNAILIQFAIGFGSLSIINVISGMISAKIFAKEEE